MLLMTSVYTESIPSLAYALETIFEHIFKLEHTCSFVELLASASFEQNCRLLIILFLCLVKKMVLLVYGIAFKIIFKLLVFRKLK